MTKSNIMIAAAVSVALFTSGILVGANTFGTPSTVLHVVTVKWTATSTPAQRQAAIDGVKKMAGDFSGIKNVWVKTIKVQPRTYDAAFAMEFADKAAFEKYTKDTAHTEWKKAYDPVHEESTTHDITN